MKVSTHTKLGALLRHPPSRELLLAVPGIPPSPYIEMLRHFSISNLLQHLGVAPDTLDALFASLEALPEVGNRDEANLHVVPSDVYEASDVQRGSATVTASKSATRWGIHEISLAGPSHGNPFLDVRLHATFSQGEHACSVAGFYDGVGTYRVRFMPETEGEWTYTTSSNARSLDGISGSFMCMPASVGAHGPVRVADTFHFAHADGTLFRPIGTTAYAWNHQGEQSEAKTLATLATSAFNKVRMCVFPKWYPFNEVEPEHQAYELLPDGSFDLGRFNPAFFAHLEECIANLAILGIEADLILFHPYDKWGYCDMPATADDRYLGYLIARLASHANVWWSLANEYDFLGDKEAGDWVRIGELIDATDPHDHLIGVHNGTTVYDNSLPWVTHASIQSQGHETQPEMAHVMRTRWGKPVMIDECCYEGDIEFGFGNLTGEDMTRRFWDATARGAYVTHGECYRDPDDTLWWGKGGVLKGTSPERLQFLRDVVSSAPGPLDPVESRRGYATVGSRGSWFLSYHGTRQPSERTLEVPEGQSYRVEVLDTWNMTIDDIGVHVGGATVEIPARPYLALRMVAVD